MKLLIPYVQNQGSNPAERFLVCYLPLKDLIFWVMMVCNLGIHVAKIKLVMFYLLLQRVNFDKFQQVCFLRSGPDDHFDLLKFLNK